MTIGLSQACYNIFLRKQGNKKGGFQIALNFIMGFRLPHLEARAFSATMHLNFEATLFLFFLLIYIYFFFLEFA